VGHVQDRWWKEVKDPVTDDVTKVKTSLYGQGLRYKVRYLDPSGVEKSKSFPDRQKKRADAFLIEVESTKLEGKYVDPKAGNRKFKTQAENWIKAQSPDAASREAVQSRLDSRINPHFGEMPLGKIKPATIREWLGKLDEERLSENYKTVLFTTVSSVLDSAVEDKLIIDNPCKAKTIKRPVSVSPDIVVWPDDRVMEVEGSIDPRFAIVVPLGAGCGLRQGEILGVSPDDIDEEGMVLRVQRQLRVVRGTLVFAPPKGGKRRVVPLASGVLVAIKEHTKLFAPVTVTLPWKDPGGEPVTVRLLATGENGRLYTGDLFHKVVWMGAFREAGIKYRGRADGMHALRHFFASVLLAQGVSIKELAEYLGHSDPGFTLRIYTHMVPSSHERARLAINGVFGGSQDHGLEAA
jgi:integrase